MRYNKELSIFPEGEEPDLLEEAGSSGEQLAELAGRMRKTVLPPALYMALLMAGGSKEVAAPTAGFEQAWQQEIEQPTLVEPAFEHTAAAARPLYVAAKKHATPENVDAVKKKQEYLLSQAVDEDEKDFIVKFELLEPFELEDLRLVTERLGEEAVRSIRFREFVTDLQAGSEVAQPLYHKFEKFYYPTDKLRQLIDETFPLQMRENLAALYYHDQFMPMPAKYGKQLAGTTDRPKYEAAHANQKSLEVTITNTPRKPGSRELRFTIGHELAHLYSPWSAYRNPAHKQPDYKCLHVMAELTKRVEAPDMYDSSYVKAIQSDTPEETLELKMKEYWAEIVAAKFNGDVLSKEDDDLLLYWFGDINFDAYKKRFETLWKETWKNEDARVEKEWKVLVTRAVQTMFLIAPH